MSQNICVSGSHLGGRLSEKDKGVTGTAMKSQTHVYASNRKIKELQPLLRTPFCSETGRTRLGEYGFKHRAQ